MEPTSSFKPYIKSDHVRKKFRKTNVKIDPLLYEVVLVNHEVQTIETRNHTTAVTS